MNHQFPDTAPGSKIDQRFADEVMKRTNGDLIMGIAIPDGDGTIQQVNPFFCDITGYTRNEAVLTNPRILKADRHDAGSYQAM